MKKIIYVLSTLLVAGGLSMSAFAGINHTTEIVLKTPLHFSHSLGTKDFGNGLGWPVTIKLPSGIKINGHYSVHSDPGPYRVTFNLTDSLDKTLNGQMIQICPKNGLCKSYTYRAFGKY